MDSELALALRVVPDDELLRRLSDLACQSRRIEADLVAHIGEVDERRLFARQAFPSMFAYCTQGLHLSEADAYRRITVARAARTHPELLEALRDGRLHLSGLALLVSVVNVDNCATLLARAAHRTRRQIDELVVALSPRPDAPSIVRKLPQRRDVELFPGRVAASAAEHMSCATAGSAAAPTATSPSPLASSSLPLATLPGTRTIPVQPLSPARFKVQFTASAELRDKLERLAALLRSEIPDGDLAAVIERAVSEKLDRLEARRFGSTKAPRATLAEVDTSGASRHIPAAVRRAVRERDGSRCRYVDEHDRRCSERTRLEFHHRHPFAMGGDHRPENISLLCPQHNRLLAEHDYGQAAIRRPMGGAAAPPTGDARTQRTRIDLVRPLP